MPHSINDSSSSSSIITSSQLGEHKDDQDLWLAVHGKVYDLTSFAKDHQGGVDVLRETAGTDATESFDYAGHTDDAITTMQRFLVGRLEGSEEEDTPAALLSQSLPQPASRIEAATLPSAGRFVNISTSWWIRSISPIAILGLLVYQTLFRSRKGNSTSDGGALESDSAGGLSNAHAFSGGLVLASSMSLAGLAFLYSQFSRTLEHEKDVFSYPSVIPRRARK